MTQQGRIVILGGGFGGVYTALHLEKLGLRGTDQVTLVNRDNYFLMTPLLFEAGSGLLEPRHVVSPIRRMLRTTRFVEAEIEGVDVTRQIVHIRQTPDDEPRELPYDHLVLALGGVTNRARVPGAEHAVAFKTLADAIYLRNHIIDSFEHADIEDNPERRASLLTFVVIGGGLVGVELMGELTQFVETVRKFYRNIRPQELRFHIFDGGPTILSEMEPAQAQYATRVLSDRGVNIHNNVHVSLPAPFTVQVENGGTVAARTIVLAAGVTPSPLLEKIDVPKDARGKVQCEATLRVRGLTNVWALGDCATIPDPQGKPYPPLAQHALRQAKVLAGNLAQMQRQTVPQLKRFEYTSLGMLAALGHYKGVGRILNLRISGFFAWWIWRTYYLMQMPRWDRRLRIMLDWTVALIFHYDVVKLDLFGEQHPARRSPMTRQP